jgi:DhnA family fructose-bisphosphate aldolase class Ia
MTSRTTAFIVIQPRLTRCLFLLSGSAKVRPAGQGRSSGLRRKKVQTVGRPMNGRPALSAGDSRDFADDPSSGDPKHIIKLALEGSFNGIAIQIGLARKFYWEYAGEVPLVLKLNGKTDIPALPDPLSPLNASVEEAVRLGADAVGYTLYVGSPAQKRDSGSTCGCGRTPSGSGCR